MLLGIDYGDKRIGLALAEESGPAVPWQIIEHPGLEPLLEQLQEMILETGISAIVVGRPIGMSGNITERTKITDDFIEDLRQATDIKVYTEDERLTSAAVTAATGQTRSLDDKAAAEILQTYLDRNNVSS